MPVRNVDDCWRAMKWKSCHAFNEVLIMIFQLMKKNNVVATLQLNRDGGIEKVQSIRNKDLLPLQDRISHQGLRSWWRDRAIPIKQGKIEQMLRANGYLTSEVYLTKNLGLSLTDDYWINPVTGDLTWEKVNLFENNFKENLLIGSIYNREESEEYTPNSSLQGNLEKTWIIRDGVRKLVKGNHTNLSTESINEVLIARAIQRQSMPSAEYKLIRVKGKPYDYGCISPIFTSPSAELVSAYAVITSENKRNDVSSYEHFIQVCSKNGLDESYVRRYLEFQISMDFIFSNEDRHLTNIAILRDADTLQFISMSPIFDSGKSMMVGKDVQQVTNKLALVQKTNGFKSSMYDLLQLVQDRALINLDVLPTEEDFRSLYNFDSQIVPERLEFMIEMYKRKLDLYDKFSHGQDLGTLRFSTAFFARTAAAKPTDIMEDDLD